MLHDHHNSPSWTIIISWLLCWLMACDGHRILSRQPVLANNGRGQGERVRLQFDVDPARFSETQTLMFSDGGDGPSIDFYTRVHQPYWEYDVSFQGKVSAHTEVRIIDILTQDDFGRSPVQGQPIDRANDDTFPPQDDVENANRELAQNDTTIQFIDAQKDAAAAAASSANEGNTTATTPEDDSVLFGHHHSTQRRLLTSLIEQAKKYEELEQSKVSGMFCLNAVRVRRLENFGESFQDTLRHVEPTYADIINDRLAAMNVSPEVEESLYEAALTAACIAAGLERKCEGYGPCVSAERATFEVAMDSALVQLRDGRLASSKILANDILQSLDLIGQIAETQGGLLSSVNQKNIISQSAFDEKSNSLDAEKEVQRRLSQALAADTAAFSLEKSRFDEQMDDRFSSLVEFELFLTEVTENFQDSWEVTKDLAIDYEQSVRRLKVDTSLANSNLLQLSSVSQNILSLIKDSHSREHTLSSMTKTIHQLLDRFETLGLIPLLNDLGLKPSLPDQDDQFDWVDSVSVWSVDVSSVSASDQLLTDDAFPFGVAIGVPTDSGRTGLLYEWVDGADTLTRPVARRDIWSMWCDAVLFADTLRQSWSLTEMQAWLASSASSSCRAWSRHESRDDEQEQAWCPCSIHQLTLQTDDPDVVSWLVHQQTGREDDADDLLQTLQSHHKSIFVQPLISDIVPLVNRSADIGRRPSWDDNQTLVLGNVTYMVVRPSSSHHHWPTPDDVPRPGRDEDEPPIDWSSSAQVMCLRACSGLVSPEFVRRLIYKLHDPLLADGYDPVTGAGEPTVGQLTMVWKDSVQMNAPIPPWTSVSHADVADNRTSSCLVAATRSSWCSFDTVRPLTLREADGSAFVGLILTRFRQAFYFWKGELSSVRAQIKGRLPSPLSMSSSKSRFALTPETRSRLDATVTDTTVCPAVGTDARSAIEVDRTPPTGLRLSESRFHTEGVSQLQDTVGLAATSVDGLPVFRLHSRRLVARVEWTVAPPLADENDLDWQDLGSADLQLVGQSSFDRGSLDQTLAFIGYPACLRHACASRVQRLSAAGRVVQRQPFDDGKTLSSRVFIHDIRPSSPRLTASEPSRRHSPWYTFLPQADLGSASWRRQAAAFEDSIRQSIVAELEAFGSDPTNVDLQVAADQLGLELDPFANSSNFEALGPLFRLSSPRLAELQDSMAGLFDPGSASVSPSLFQVPLEDDIPLWTSRDRSVQLANGQTDAFDFRCRSGSSVRTDGWCSLLDQYKVDFNMTRGTVRFYPRQPSQLRASILVPSVLVSERLSDVLDELNAPGTVSDQARFGLPDLAVEDGPPRGCPSSVEVVRHESEQSHVRLTGSVTLAGSQADSLVDYELIVRISTCEANGQSSTENTDWTERRRPFTDIRRFSTVSMSFPSCSDQQVEVWSRLTTTTDPWVPCFSWTGPRHLPNPTLIEAEVDRIVVAERDRIADGLRETGTTIAALLASLNDDIRDVVAETYVNENVDFSASIDMHLNDRENDTEETLADLYAFIRGLANNTARFQTKMDALSSNINQTFVDLATLRQRVVDYQRQSINFTKALRLEAEALIEFKQFAANFSNRIDGLQKVNWFINGAPDDQGLSMTKMSTWMILLSNMTCPTLWKTFDGHHSRVLDCETSVSSWAFWDKIACQLKGTWVGLNYVIVGELAIWGLMALLYILKKHTLLVKMMRVFTWTSTQSLANMKQSSPATP